MKKSFFLALAALAALTLNSTAGTLSVGDAAPELKTLKWVKGDAVTSFDPGKIYVVEFWATWCGPCRASIPHLTELAHKFKDVTFIGMDVWENGSDKEGTVTKFLKRMGDKMDYHVAMDTEDAFMAENWMKAADQNGIPAAFLVQKGKIVWIGHPMSGLEEAVGEVIVGKFDVEKAKQRSEAQNKVKAFYAKAMKGGDEAELLVEGKELESLDQKIGGISPSGEKFKAEAVLKQVKFQAAMQAYQKALISGKDDAETARLEAAAQAVAPKEVDFAAIKLRLQDYKSSQQAQQIFQKYAQAVGENGDKDKASEFAKQLSDLNLKSSETLNEFAWAILTDETIKQRDLPLALKLAKAAVDVSGGKEAAVLDTYARALFDSGKVADAIEQQKKAVAACETDSEKAELEVALKKYQAAADATK